MVHHPHNTPRYPQLVYHTSLDAMTPEEIQGWLRSVQERLQRKMKRERAYLDRRASKKRHTPTDDAYEDDLILEQELLSMVENLLDGFAQQGGGS